MPIVIEKTSATSVNLNLLSADFYALLVGLFIFHYQVKDIFYVLFFAVYCYKGMATLLVYDSISYLTMKRVIKNIKAHV